MEDKIKHLAEANFNISLKPEQLKAINSYADGRHTLLIAPTSYGKSIVYQMAPFIYDDDRYNNDSIISTTNTTTVLETSARQSSPDRQWASSDEELSTSSTGSLAHAAPDTSTPLRPEETENAAPPDTGITKPTTEQQPADDFVADLSSNMSGLSINVSRLQLETPEIPLSNTVKRMAQFLIIVPLVALISDAMNKVRGLLPYVSATHLTAATLQLAKSAVFIFTSPESIIDGTGRRLLQRGLNIRAVFIDEFHIIERWGIGDGSTTAFRAAYGRLGELRALLPDVPFIGLSATATDDTISAVTSSLNLNNPNVIRVSINKPNITYHVINVTGSVIQDFKWLATMINTTAASLLPRILIFFNNVNKLIDAYESVTTSINQPVGAESPIVVMYHLITDEAIKEAVVRDLGKMDGLIKCAFCTSSLSMGMNLAEIAYVIHYGVASTADAFLQETGRVARETLSHGHSILLSFPRQTAGRKLDDTMKIYHKAATCRRQLLLNKFQCQKPCDQDACCDICDPSLSCQIKSAILGSYDSSIADSFSDSLSIGSVGGLDDF